MSEIVEVTIRSTAWINTPGFFRYLQAMYQTEPGHAINLLIELTNQTITAEGAEGVLSGKHRHEILIDSVCLFVPAEQINQ